MALTPVDLIIKELCRETGEPEYRNYDSFVGHVIRCFSQLNIAAIQIVKTVYLKPNSYNALSWPEDCAKPLLVGLCRNGKVINIDVDESILPQRTAGESCNTVAEADAYIDSLLGGYDTVGFGIG
jgi:hypothetical protein